MTTTPASPLLEDTTGRRLVGGAMWRAASSLLPQVSTLVLSVVAARYLGPNGMGRQSYIAFVSISVASLAAGGVPYAVMRFVSTTAGAGDNASARAIIRWGWRFATACAAAGALIVAAPAFAGSSDANAWLLAAVGACIGIVNGVPWAVLTALQRWRTAALWTLVWNTLSAAVTVAVLAAGYGIVGMFAVEAAASIVAIGGSLLLTRRAIAELLPVDDATSRSSGHNSRELVSFAAMSTVNLMLTFLVLRRTELFALRRYSTDQQIALYSISFAAVGALQQIPLAIQSVLLPAMATLWGAGDLERLRSGVARAVRLMVVICAPVAAGVAALGPSLVAVVYGKAYAGVTSSLVTLALVVLVVPVGAVGSATLGATAKLRPTIRANAVAVVVDVALALLLIPAHGALGAAIANTAAQSVAGAMVLWAAVRQLQPLPWNASVVLRGCVVPAAAGVVSWAVCHLNTETALGVITGFVAGAFVYVVLATIVKVMPKPDADWVSSASSTRGLGFVGRIAHRWAG